ncbi:hypothetical protein SDC9_97606 [bioreactor metagenome]|uniref:Uncharacterized protein n=1 Tax=bioreactor metagenome TaxID=1076179 RepID=A0A645ACH5_9ZZZZ
MPGQKIDHHARQPGIDEGSDHHEQSDEQHQQLPVDFAQHISARQHMTAQQQSGSGHRNQIMRIVGEYEKHDQDGQDAGALDGAPAVERQSVIFRNDGFAVVGQLEGAPSQSVNHAIADQERKRHRRRREKHVRAEGEVPDGADQNVLGVADGGQRAADVGGQCQTDQERHRIEFAVQQRRRDYRSDRKHHYVVVEKGREHASKHDQHRQKIRRTVKQGMQDGPGDPAVESGEMELRRDHHQCEKQQDRLHIDRCDRLGQIDAAEGEHGDGAEQRDSGPVELQKKPVPDRQSEIGGQKNDQRGDSDIIRTDMDDAGHYFRFFRFFSFLDFFAASVAGQSLS